MAELDNEECSGCRKPSLVASLNLMKSARQTLLGTDDDASTVVLRLGLGGVIFAHGAQKRLKEPARKSPHP